MQVRQDTSVQSSPMALRYLTIGLVAASTVSLLAVPDLQWFGWLQLGLATILALTQYKKRYEQYLIIIIATVALLGVTPISTDLSTSHLLIMFSAMLLTLVVPYYIVNKVLHTEKVITFPFHVGRIWKRADIAYLTFAVGFAYFVLPYYFAVSGSYQNWDVSLTADSIFRLFIGINLLGTWDEIFFVGVCLLLLWKIVPFIWANIAQAVIWAAFLYELGFRGWFGPILVFSFAMIQGFLFKKTRSLTYLVTVHLAVDLVLFLVLIHLHHPEYVRIFITSPF